jgi:hypothetical protein
MIIYDLLCSNFHQFEGWFRGLEDYESQKARSLVRCPICDTEEVDRKVSAPKVTQKSNAKATSSVAEKAEQITHALPQLSGTNSEQYAQVQKMLKQVHKYIDSNFTDVGNQFSEKAKEIHNGDAEPENIKGSATSEQLKELSDMGISTMPIPPKPVDKNKLN